MGGPPLILTAFAEVMDKELSVPDIWQCSEKDRKSQILRRQLKLKLTINKR